MLKISWKFYIMGVILLVVLYYLLFFIAFWRLKRGTKRFLDMEKQYEEKFGHKHVADETVSEATTDEPLR